MAALVDTSAIVAHLDGDEERHDAATRAFAALTAGGETLHIHSFAVGETVALLQRRYGIDAVRAYTDRIAPLLSVVWIGRDLYERAMAATLASEQRSVSFVDQLSFAVMRDLGIRRAFAFDGDFVKQGFELVEA